MANSLRNPGSFLEDCGVESKTKTGVSNGTGVFRALSVDVVGKYMYNMCLAHTYTAH